MCRSKSISRPARKSRLRGRLLGLAAGGLAASFAIAVVLAFLLAAGGQVDTPPLVAIILVATSLGVVVPVLKDAGEGIEAGYGYGDAVALATNGEVDLHAAIRLRRRGCSSALAVRILA